MAKSKAVLEITNRNSLDVKTIVGKTQKDLQKAMIEAQAEIKLCRIVGVVGGCDVKETQYGIQITLFGEFEAINLESGEVFSTRKLFLPNSMSEPLKADLNKSDFVKFALEVSIVPNTSMVYEYVGTPMIESQGKVLLNELKSELSGLLTA